MRTFLGLFGAIIGAVFGFFLLGQAVADLYMGMNDFTNPDDAGDAHAVIFVTMTLSLLAFGYAVGFYVGGKLDREDWSDVEEL